jgi:hypothetical protein
VQRQQPVVELDRARASPARAATHISCMSRGATLAVTEITPSAPSWM